MKKSVANNLREAGFVLEACHGNKSVSFELWVNHALKDAFVIWTMTKDNNKHCYLAKFMSGTPEVAIGSPTDDRIVVTTDWIGILESLGRAFVLAFPDEGSCYPEILNRAFLSAMENFDGGPLSLED